eukprot:TRINITY_DN2325_c0_g2_i6.p1 TRINITY_DN2325_c0_g2~~TRINITY_DN2325_c0_g2_i6.p1  ORF type:complete len:545 (+),score=161.88 TRINITY_DN2325_c0_g2_i6:214-1848(+)
MAQAKQAGGPPREQLVKLIVGMLEKSGPKLAGELNRRVAAGEALVVRGIRVEVDALEEALERYEGGGEEDQKKDSPGKSAKWVPPVPAGKQSAGRWTPGPPSASLLAARAMMECENAETFSSSVKVTRGQRVHVLERPDCLNAPTGGECLPDDEAAHEVVARFVSKRDGRVYFRLRRDTPSWISSRAHEDMSQVVLELAVVATGTSSSSTAGGQAKIPLEPPKCAEPLNSSALRLLPEVNPEALPSPSKAAASSSAAAAAEGDEDEMFMEEEDDAGDEEQDGVDEVEAMAEEGGGGVEEEAEGEDVAPAEGADEDAEAASEMPDISEAAAEDDEEEDAPASQGDAASQSQEATPQKVSTLRPRKFKVVAGRCPVLPHPSASQLFATGPKVMLKMKQEFWADAAVRVPAEGRVYLRLRNGKGWVCERSRTDIRRMAIVPTRMSKQPISSRHARVLAFRGADTDGRTTLHQDDLIRNSRGKIVSKKMAEASKKRYEEGIGKWTAAVKRAREELGLTGFVKVKKGTPVYEKAQEYYKAAKAAKTEAE